MVYVNVKLSLCAHEVIWGCGVTAPIIPSEGTTKK